MRLLPRSPTRQYCLVRSSPVSCGAGLTPPNSVVQILTEMLVWPLLRYVGLFYLLSYNRITAKGLPVRCVRILVDCLLLMLVAFVRCACVRSVQAATQWHAAGGGEEEAVKRALLCMESSSSKIARLDSCVAAPQQCSEGGQVHYRLPLSFSRNDACTLRKRHANHLHQPFIKCNDDWRSQQHSSAGMLNVMQANSKT